MMISSRVFPLSSEGGGPGFGVAAEAPAAGAALEAPPNGDVLVVAVGVVPTTNARSQVVSVCVVIMEKMSVIADLQAWQHLQAS